MKVIRPLLAVLTLLCWVAAFSACGPQPLDCAQEGIFCVGLVTAYEGVENQGLNQLTWQALKSIESQAHIAHLDYIESVDARDWQKNLLYFAEGGYDVIVTVGSGLAEDTRAVASEFSQLSFIGVNQQFDEYPGNVATIRFSEDQAGFLAGMLAALVSPSGNIGAVCEASGIEVVWQYCEGFRAGASYEKEEIEVSVVYRDSGGRDQTFNDPEWGRQAMLALIGNGVDTMTAFGGNTAQGAYLAAGEKVILVIGSEEDLYYRLPEVQPTLVTSLIKDPGKELSSLVLSASAGGAVTGSHTGQVGLAPFRLPQFAIDLELKSYLEETLEKMRSGEIEINLPEH